jgi:hypothetical protein
MLSTPFIGTHFKVRLVTDPCVDAVAVTVGEPSPFFICDKIQPAEAWGKLSEDRAPGSIPVFTTTVKAVIAPTLPESRRLSVRVQAWTEEDHPQIGAGNSVDIFCTLLFFLISLTRTLKMAVRSPTTFNHYLNANNLDTRQNIITTEPSSVADDQQFCFSKPEILMSDCFFPYILTTTTFRNTAYYSVKGRDLGAAPGSVETVEYCVYAWASAAINFEVGVYNPNTASWIITTVVANQTTPLWRGWTPDANVLQAPTDGTAVEYILGGRPLVGGNTLYICGLGIFVP